MGVEHGLLVLAIIGLAVGPAAAQEGDDALRPCRRADLIGLWEVIRFGFAVRGGVDRSDPAYRPHQRYVFNANATMTYAASATPPTNDDHRALLLEPSPVTWALDAGGRLMRQREGAPRVEISDCRVVTRRLSDRRSPLKSEAGDVLLTDLADDAQPLARRLLRKLGSGNGAAAPRGH